MTRLARLLALAAFSLTASCEAPRADAIVVAVSSEAAVPDGVKTFELRATRAGEVVHSSTHEVQAGRVQLPGTLTFVDDGEREGPVSIELFANVVAAGGVERVAARRAVLGFSPGKQKLLRLPIQLSCLDVACPGGETCRAGRCVADRVDGEALADFDEAAALPTAGRCFDREACEAAGAGETRFAPGRISLSIEQVADAIGDDCTLPYVFDVDPAAVRELPTSAPEVAALRASINMGLVFSGDYDRRNEGKADASQGHWTVVDKDLDDGWAYADEYAQAGRAALSRQDLDKRAVLTPGLCAAVHRDRDAIRRARADASARGKGYQRPRTALLGTVEVRGCAPKPASMPACR